MSVEAMSIALNHSRATGAAKVILLGIANHDGDGGSWPSIGTLARYANVTDRQVQRALQTLESLGEIRRVVGAGGTAQTPEHRRPNLFEIRLSCPPWCDGSRRHRDTRRGARHIPMTLDLDPLTPASPGDTSVTPPPTPASPHPVTPASPELNKRTTREDHEAEEISHSTRAGDERDPIAAAAARYAEVIHLRHPVEQRKPDVPTRPPCPKRRRIPCSYNAEHICPECGGVDPAHVDVETGELA